MVKRPTGFVKLDERGNEISNYGKSIFETLGNDKGIDSDTEKELEDLFGSDVAKSFGRGDDGLPRNVNGEIIDNKKVTITSVKKPQGLNNNR